MSRAALRDHERCGQRHLVHAPVLRAASAAAGTAGRARSAPAPGRRSSPASRSAAPRSGPRSRRASSRRSAREPPLVEERVAAGVELAQPAARERRDPGDLGGLPVAARERDLDAALVGQRREEVASAARSRPPRRPGRSTVLVRRRAPPATTARRRARRRAARAAAQPTGARGQRPAQSAHSSSGPPKSAPSRTALPPIGVSISERERAAERVEHGAPAQRALAPREQRRSSASAEERDRQVGGERNGAQPPSGKADGEEHRRDAARRPRSRRRSMRLPRASARRAASA